jgi:hypothetical protein
MFERSRSLSLLGIPQNLYGNTEKETAMSVTVSKVKVLLYLTKHHAMKAYWGSGGTCRCIPNLGTKWR